MASKQKGKNIASSKNNDDKRKVGGKATWDQKSTKILIELCKAEVLTGNRRGTHARNPVWKIVTPKFNELTRKDYGQNQLKNKWDNLRRDWQLWKTLIGGTTGLGWDNVKGTLAVDDEWWEARLKVVPNAVKFQKRAPEHLDDMEILFNNTVATGEFASTPNSGKLHEEEKVPMENDPQLVEVGEDSDGGDNIGLENITAETNTNPTYPRTEGMDEERKKQKTIEHEFNNQKEENRERKTIGAAAKLSRQLNRIYEVMESKSSAKCSTTSMMTSISGSSIAEVMELVENIPEIDPGDELYMLATRLFIKRENREMFVALKRPHIQLAWLKQELAREGQNA